MAESVAGADRLKAMLRALPEKVARTELRKSVVPGARLVRNAARARARVRTGRMRRNIIIKFAPELSNKRRVVYIVTVRRGKKFQKMKRRRKGQEVLVNEDAYYWVFQEFGTAKMAANPFLRPAFRNNRDAALRLIKNNLREGVIVAYYNSKR